MSGSCTQREDIIKVESFTLDFPALFHFSHGRLKHAAARLTVRQGLLVRNLLKLLVEGPVVFDEALQRSAWWRNECVENVKVKTKKPNTRAILSGHSR